MMQESCKTPRDLQRAQLPVVKMIYPGSNQLYKHFQKTYIITYTSAETHTNVPILYLYTRHKCIRMEGRVAHAYVCGTHMYVSFSLSKILSFP